MPDLGSSNPESLRSRGEVASSFGWRTMPMGMEQVNPDCANASNPFHVCAEYCAQRGHPSKPRNLLPKLVVAAHKDDRRVVEMERGADSSCRNASNPYHQCAEYCSTKTPMVKGQREGKRSVNMVRNGERDKEDQEIVVSERSVDPLCKNASNPYHECAEYCCSGNPQLKRENEKGSVHDGSKMEASKMVNSSCVDKSNQVCAEHFAERRNVDHHIDGGKSVVTADHERKGGLSTEVMERIHPNCANASNPYHKCAAYCFQKNQSK